VRKHLAGLSPTDRVRGSEQDAPYAEGVTDQVYEALLERADPVVGSGLAAVLDATWSRRRCRARALRVAAERGLRPLFVETRCAREVALARLSARMRAGRDPSDAGPERFDLSVSAFEAASEWPEDARLSIDTDRDGWKQELQTRLQRALS
jgi:hypothetical protein